MIIVTAKVPRRKLAFSAAAATFLCCAALVLSLVPPAHQQTAALSSPNPKGVRNNKDRVAYLEHFGWAVSPEPISVEELEIPEELDDRYTEYLNLQANQGFDLTQYAGKRVRRYTYSISNYPTGESGIVVKLLLCKNTVIGGEVLSPTPNGFLHGLAMPQLQTEKDRDLHTQTSVQT